MGNLLNIGTKVKKLREFKNLGQEHMAYKMGISQSQYSRLESGECSFKEGQLEQIAKLLKLSVEQIQSFEPNSGMPIINNHADIVSKNKNISYYQIDPALEKQYQGHIKSLNKNISLLEDKISYLEAQNKILKSENERLKT